MAIFDASRGDDDRRKHYTRVMMQQGRTFTDYDWNQSEWLDNEAHRRTHVDVIGPFGSPDAGFRIRNPRFAGGRPDFEIEAGTLYLGGLRLELEAAATPETYLAQQDWLLPPDADLDVNIPGGERFDLVYLEAWQQPVCAVEDASLFEPALGGPDTTTRLRNTHRVRVRPNAGFGECADAWNRLKQQWQDDHLGTVNEQHERVPDIRLTVTYTGAALPDDLCSPAVAGGYLGAENQAIRVQLTRPGTFTWGFNNAAPLYRVALLAGNQVQMLTEPKDQYHWPRTGQVVELLPWSAVLPNGQKIAAMSGHLARVGESFDPDSGLFTLAAATAPPPGFGLAWQSRPDAGELGEPAPYFYLRVWDRGDDRVSPPEIPFTDATPVALGTTGLVVAFTGPDRVAEDHWVIAVRPETPNQVVPWELEEGMLPHGVRRFFAPLAVIRWQSAGGQLQGQVVHDCRKTFRPLTDLDGCCTFTVGDGIRSRGDFNSIEEAVGNLPPAGGKICVLPGVHEANVTIANQTQVRITGCGEQTVVRPHGDDKRRGLPIFRMAASRKIQLDNLVMEALEGTAIVVEDQDPRHAPSQEITIRDNSILAGIHGIRVSLPEDRRGNNVIEIYHNRVAILDGRGGDVAIFVAADEVRIERNRVVVLPPPDPDDSDDPRNEDGPDDLFDPCPDRKGRYQPGYPLRQKLSRQFAYLMAYVPANQKNVYTALGGIQVGGASERVLIRQNEIIGGRGNGITLGHLPAPDEEQLRAKTFEKRGEHTYVSKAFVANDWFSDQSREEVTARFNNVLYDITIEGNHIHRMGLSGIGVAAFLNTRKIGLVVRVEDLTVDNNRIMHCARQLPAALPDDMQDEVAFGGIALAACENGIFRQNRIEDNGLSHQEPVCGLFILYAEKIEIAGNRIVNNGPRTALRKEGVRPGTRGGVVIRMSFQPRDLESALALGEPLAENIPALKMHDNIVAQPLGHALWLTAFGPVSVAGNQFTSQGIEPRSAASRLAGCVLIVNLGLPRDFFGGALLRNLPNQNTREIARTSQAWRALQYLPGGKVLFTANQSTLDLRGEERTVGVSAQLIVSLDDVGFTGNQSECAALLLPEPATYDVVVLNTFLAGFSVRCNDNRFTEGFTFTFFSLLSYAWLNTTVSNQATHCLIALGNRLAEGGNLVLNEDLCKRYAELMQRTLGAPRVNNQETPP